MVRQYAQIVGVIIILVGVGGLLLGERSLFDALNIDVAEDIVHLVTGGLLAYAGFRLPDLRMVRNIVGGLGVVYVLVGILGFIVPDLFGLLPHEYSPVDNLFHIALGAVNIAVAWFLERGRTATV